MTPFYQLEHQKVKHAFVSASKKLKMVFSIELSEDKVVVDTGCVWCWCSPDSADEGLGLWCNVIQGYDSFLKGKVAMCV